jgi:hypothetical protein
LLVDDVGNGEAVATDCTPVANTAFGTTRLAHDPPMIHALDVLATVRWSWQEEYVL